MAESEESPYQRFESIKQINPYGAEYWSARELMPLLGYEKWQRAEDVIARARSICELAAQDVSLHFSPAYVAVAIGSGAQREIADYQLTRYALHLVLVCSDQKKAEVAQGLAYITLSSLGDLDQCEVVASVQSIQWRTEIARTKEQLTIGQIMHAFKHLRMSRQYRVEPYFVDLYFPDYHLAIECDEDGHRRYAQEAEQRRQRYIEDALDCALIRYNPDAPDFNIGDVINDIMLFVHSKDGDGDVRKSI